MEKKKIKNMKGIKSEIKSLMKRLDKCIKKAEKLKYNSICLKNKAITYRDDCFKKLEHVISIEKGFNIQDFEELLRFICEYEDLISAIEKEIEVQKKQEAEQKKKKWQVKR